MEKQNIKRCAVIGFFSLCLIAGAAAAKYIQSANQLTNVFQPAPYDTPIINEELKTDTDGLPYKTEVSVKAAKTDYPVYVRASFVINWQDENGNVLGTPPAQDTDYSLEYNDTDWAFNSADGFYYYKSKLQSGSTTAPLIVENQKLKQISESPAGYSMHVDVLAQTIQAVGTMDSTESITAVYDAWGVQPDNTE